MFIATTEKSIETVEKILVKKVKTSAFFYGMVTMPLEKAIWGDTFGMCIDKFGVQWIVDIAGPKA